MPNRPSDPLLGILREAARKRQLSTPVLAEQTGIERGALKRKLSGTDDLTVDEFLLLAQAMDLQSEMAGLVGRASAEGDVPRTLRSVQPPVVDEPPPMEPERAYGLDPYGNAARQLVEGGFALGLDMFVHLDRAQIEHSGVPRQVLADKRFASLLPIRLEPRFHKHNAPQFLDDELVLRLSFDALYTCHFPWSALRQVTFTLPEEEPPRAEPPAPKTPARPVLRLVKE